MFSLDGRIIVITGAAGNLGRAVAERCLGAGAQTVLVDRGSDRLRGCFPAIAGAPGHLLLSGVDLLDAAAADAVAERTLERFGRIDGLVHTVGGYRGGQAAYDDAADTLDFLLDVNLHTAVLACRALVPPMVRQQAGRVVTVGAMAALTAPPGLVAYATAKAALIRFTEGLARDVRPAGVSANIILPSIIDTPENRALMPDENPAGWVSAQAIADVVLFLLSDQARAVTGAAIPVPGVW